MEFKNVTIAIFAVDELESLKKTVEAILSLCKKDDIKEIIIMLSEYTPEACIAVARGIVEEYPEYDIKIMFPEKGNRSSAYTKVISAASGSHLITVSADLSINLDTAPEYIRLSKENPDKIITASRWLQKGSYIGYPKWRYIVNFLSQKLFGVMFFVKYTDITNAHKLMPLDIVKDINLTEKGYNITLELTLKLIRLGVKFIEVPCKCYKRTEGKSHNSVWKMAYYYITALKVRFMRKKDIKFKS